MELQEEEEELESCAEFVGICRLRFLNDAQLGDQTPDIILELRHAAVNYVATASSIAQRCATWAIVFVFLCVRERNM